MHEAGLHWLAFREMIFFIMDRKISIALFFPPNYSRNRDIDVKDLLHTLWRCGITITISGESSPNTV